jgi:hypothetical protein
MNDLGILLPGSGKTAIGTQDLNGCTAIVILGDAILVAHISPPTDPWPAGQDHLERHMSGITNFLTRHRNYFPEHTTTWGFFGAIDGNPTPGVVETVTTHLSRDGLLVQPRIYKAAPGGSRGLAAGELIAAFRSNAIELYFKTTLVETKPLPMGQVTAGSSTELV